MVTKFHEYSAEKAYLKKASKSRKNNWFLQEPR